MNLNLVVFKMKGLNKSYFAELISIDQDANLVQLNNIIEVNYGVDHMTALPFSPFCSNTKFVFDLDSFIFIEPLDILFYKFYCNIVMSIRVMYHDARVAELKTTSSKLERNAELLLLNNKFKNYLSTDENFNDYSNEIKRTLH